MIIFPVISGILFFISGLLILQNGHLHEDAYILFQYSKNFALGNGITFDSSSGPLEGATDFLWMISIGLLSKITGDLAVSALLLNSLGLSILIYLIIKIRSSFDLITFFLCLTVIFSGGLSAAIGGFSTLAYASLYALLTINIINKKYFYIVFLTIAISLFRPDGVILTIGALTSLLLFSKKEDVSKAIVCILISSIIGFIYFIWRWNYFDSILPLPLLVKQHTDSLLEGLHPNYDALKRYFPLLITSIFFFNKKDTNKYCAILFGPLLLFISLSFMHQSQNIGDRFQFVIIVSIILLYTYSIPNNIKGKYLYLLLILPLIAIFHGKKVIINEVKYLTNSDYINNFPQLLKESNFTSEKIAITEAGRFPFWFNAKKMIDLVGLNSKDVVIKGANKVLESENPELIFVNHADRYNFKKLNLDNSKNFIIVNPGLIFINEYSGTNPVKLAPVYALRYAQKYNYTTVLVKYGSNDKNYDHVYFINKRLNIEKFLKILNESFYIKTSYFSSKEFLKKP